MDLSPNDIRSYEFPNQMRGYAREEVDNFLDRVADALEGVKHENLKLSMEIESLKSQLAGLMQFEDTIKSAAIDARRNADMTIATAKQEAEMITSKARTEADNLIAQRSRDVAEIENQITKLGLTKKSYLSKIRSLIQAHLEMVDEIDAVEIDGARASEAIKITQSTDLTTEQRETVASRPSETPSQTVEEAPAMTADEESVAVDSDVAKDVEDAIRADEPEVQPESKQPIDPELAAALESYKKTTTEQVETENVYTPPAGTSPPQGVVVETTARAEDIPDGFIAKEEELDNERATDKVPVAEADTSAEPNSLNPDESTKASPNPLDPDSLAGELDEVATKFDEEMDKAEKS